MTTLLLAVAYLVTPLGILLLLSSFIYASSKSNKYILFFGLTFGVIGYCSVPIRVIDITRYFQTIDALKGMTLHEAMAGNGNGLVVTTFWFWLVSKIGDNNILPFMSMTTIHSILCYIVVDSLKERKKAIKYFLLLLVLRFPFYSVYSNVRNVSAFALLALALYRDLIKNKRGIITIACDRSASAVPSVHKEISNFQYCIDFGYTSGFDSCLHEVSLSAYTGRYWLYCESRHLESLYFDDGRF